MESKRPGRKPMVAGKGQRMSLGLKVTPQIKNALDAAAKANGRTQSQEAEARIEGSFKSEEYLSHAFDFAYGPKAAGLLMLIGRVANEVGHWAEFQASTTAAGRADWLSNPTAFNAVRASILQVLDNRAPDGAVTGPAHPLAQNRTRQLLASVRNPQKGDTWAEAVHKRLGDAVERIKVEEVTP
jgi:hypothetical protein